MKKRMIVFMLVFPLLMSLWTAPVSAETVDEPSAGTDTPHYGTLEEMAADMRSHMVARDENFTVYLNYRPTSYDQEQMTNEMLAMIGEGLELAMSHTGVPVEGDYLRLMWSDWKIDYQVAGFSGNGLNLGLSFYFDYFTTAQQEAEMDAAVDQLLSSLDLDGKTDYEKIHAIYDYMVANISYTADNSDPVKNSAYGALVEGSAVCHGFSALFYRLALELGIDARLVRGTSSGQSHSWNIVELDGLYYNADAMWDSKLAEKGLPWQCFLVSDANLSNHVRTGDYASEAFCGQYPMGEENYAPVLPDIPDEIASGWSGDTTWVLTSDGVLTFTGEGNMKNYGFSDPQPWADYADVITQVVVQEGVTRVGSGAFRGMTALESVTLPESSLGKIGEAAFYGCTALKEIYIPDSVYTIWAYTFKDCELLSSVRLPRQLAKIDQGAFENCIGLTTIFIPGQTRIIGAWSFKGCTALKSADLQWADATEIREGAFKNCSSLDTVLFPEGIQILGDSAFYGIGMESMTVPATVTEVGAWCFARSGLKEIVFTGDAPTIGGGAFNKITLNACYPADNDTWNTNIQQNYGGTVAWIAR